MPTSWIDTLKRIPIDLGQGSVAETTEGKQIALRLVREGYGKRALDVGCRKGKQTIWLRSKGYTVTSIDVTCEIPDCQVVDVNQALPFPSNHFDLVWCSEVIEHLKDPLRALKEFRRVTVSGGSDYSHDTQQLCRCPSEYSVCLACPRSDCSEQTICIFLIWRLLNNCVPMLKCMAISHTQLLRKQSGGGLDCCLLRL